MNKLNYFLLGAAGLALASCSQEEIVNNNNGGEVTATFNVSLPLTFETRAGDGAAATNLYVGVYDADNNNSYLYTAEGDFGSGPAAKVSVNLTPGKNYFFTFFAGNPEAVSLSDNSAVYYLNEETGALTVNYDEMTSEGNLADLYDCFYEKLSMTNVGNSEVSANVTLKRPVAQINWSTNDFEDYATIFGNNGEYIQSKLTADVFTSMNLITGEVAGLDNGYEFPPFAIPSDETFAIEGYDYVAYQYVLAPSAVDYINLSLLISNAGNPQASSYKAVTVNVNDAVLQANYQTNIYGSLLSGEVTNVSKDEWVSGYNPDLHWDGKTVTYPQVADASTPVVIGKASDLAGLANMVNGTAEDGSPANDFSGYTISLAADFDMGGKEFPGIGKSQRSSSSASGNAFRGTFDGQNHTISNLVINGSTDENDAPGFIGNLDGSNAVLKDVTFENLTINAENNEQAGVVGLVTNGATVSGVELKSGSVISKQAAGGIVGRVLKYGTIESCKNGASVSASQYNCGGIVGAAYYTSEGTNMYIKNCENTGTISSGYGVGGIVGLSCAEVSGCTNSGDVTGTSASVGGIVGEQKSAGSITDCTNNATITGGEAQGIYGTGGIVGWVRYQAGDAYARQNIIEVSGNTNNGAVSGSTGVAGIVGTWFQCGVCYSNLNYAPSIASSGGFVAGIVGNSQWVANDTVNEKNITGPSGNPEGNTNALFVQNNYSNTPQDKVTGSLNSPFVYINSADKTFASGNSMTQTDVVKNPFTPTESTSENSWSDWN